MTPESPFAVPTIATIPANTSSAEARSTLARLHDLAQEQENFQSRLAALREERDSLILRGLAHGLSSSELAATSHLTGARVRAIADAAASSSARERVSRAISRLVEHKPAVCTTYGALAAAVGIVAILLSGCLLCLPVFSLFSGRLKQWRLPECNKPDHDAVGAATGRV